MNTDYFQAVLVIVLIQSLTTLVASVPLYIAFHYSLKRVDTTLNKTVENIVLAQQVQMEQIVNQCFAEIKHLSGKIPALSATKAMSPLSLPSRRPSRKATATPGIPLALAPAENQETVEMSPIS